MEHLVQPVACPPASGRDKGQVENQVGLVREQVFTPRLRVKSLDELNAWLLDKCATHAKAHRHVEAQILRTKTSAKTTQAVQDPMNAMSAARPVGGCPVIA